MRKPATLLLIAVLVLSGLVMVGCVSAQSVTKPSVPEFTVTFEAQNRTIFVTIKDQRFTSYNDSDGDLIRLFYSVRVKSHFEDSWASTSLLAAPLNSSDSEYTLKTYTVGNSFYGELIENASAGDKLDFQVEALIGKYSQYLTKMGMQTDFEGEVSSWSEIQTLTIEEVPTPSPEATPIEPALVLGVIGIVAVFVFGLVLLYRIKRK